MTEPKRKETAKNDEEKQQLIKDKEKEWADLLKESKEAEEQKEQEKESKMEDKMERTRERPQQLSGPKSKYTLFVQIGVVILIAIAVCYFMVPRIAPSIGEYTGQVARINADMTDLRSLILAVNATIPDISGLATKAELNNYARQSDYNTVSSRVGNVETSLSELENNLISQLKPTVEYNLTGTFGNYTLSARTSTAGNFTARLNLVYSPPKDVGAVNSTLEEALLSFNSTWLTSLDKNYTPSLAYDNQWKISQVSFLTGKFSLSANNLTTQNITFTGLNVTPDYVFAEVFKVV